MGSAHSQAGTFWYCRGSFEWPANFSCTRARNHVNRTNSEERKSLFMSHSRKVSDGQ